MDGPHHRSDVDVVTLRFFRRCRFTPEVLGQVSSSCLVTQLVEIGIISMAMFFTGSGSIPTLDLLAYTGYKYVGYANPPLRDLQQTCQGSRGVFVCGPADCVCVCDGRAQCQMVKPSCVRVLVCVVVVDVVVCSG